MANRAIKYRVYPASEQAELFAKTFDCCRKVYNLMLADRIKAYKDTGSFGKQTPAMYKKEYPYLKEIDSLALANVQLNLQQAFSNCFDKKRKKCNGFPKFKSKRRSKKTYTTNNQKGTVAVTDNGIRLPKVGVVKAKLHRLPKEDWYVKSATVSQDRCGNYYVSVLFDYDSNVEQTAPSADKVLGLDMSVPHLYVDNDGNKGSDTKFYKSAMSRLAREQRKLSHMRGSRKGEAKSSNWHKQNAKVNRIHRHIADKRLDYLHKKSKELADTYDVIGIEDILVSEVLEHRDVKCYHRCVLDNGWGIFVSLLDYKLADRGKRLVRVDRNYPSTQTCSSCGYINRRLADDSIRKWECPECGTKHDRDVNAAINIHNEAVRIVFA